MVKKEEKQEFLNELGLNESGLDTSFYFEMLPVDNEAYEILKREYEKIDFSPNFQKGDENTYENYEKIYSYFCKCHSRRSMYSYWSNSFFIS